MKRFWISSAAALVVFGMVVANGQVPRRKPSGAPAPAAEEIAGSKGKVDDEQVRQFMRLKLDHSQKVLEGVVMKDFGLIAKNAQAMALLTEDENWMLLETPEYRAYSDEFKRIANRLTKAAQEKNLDEAALDYVQLTLNCVDCHKHVREND